jgi:hypothetical protein
MDRIQAKQLLGQKAIDRSGHSFGRIKWVVPDQGSEQFHWALVELDVPKQTRYRVVPLMNAARGDAGIRFAFPRHTVLSAPLVTKAMPSEWLAIRFAEHYNLRGLAGPRPPGLPTGPTPPDEPVRIGPRSPGPPTGPPPPDSHGGRSIQ